MIKTKSKLSGFLFFIVALFSSTLSGQNDNSPIKNDRIKGILISGKKTTNFIYNKFGKISEVQGLNSWQKFFYNSDGRLQKEEIYYDLKTLSSGSSPISPAKKELMTSKNTTVTAYTIFEYDKEGRVAKIKHYSKMGADVFEFRSITLLTYEGPNIIKSSLHDTMGIITHFNNYQYDSKGNVINEEYYYCSSKNLKPTLISKTSYTYDNKKIHL